MSNILIVALALLAFGCLAGRLSGTPVTMPMLFTAAGALLGPAGVGALDVDLDSQVVSLLAEASLAVILFTDASRLDLRTVWSEHDLALRLLLLGLPLAVLLGTGAGWLILPGLPLVAIALIAAALAPTDAALGQAFVSDKTVPARIRQTLNVESGLNDGLALVFVVVLLDIARQQINSPQDYILVLTQLVGIGVLIGALVGWLGGQLVSWSAARGWTTETTQRLATIAVAIVAYASSELASGNGFIAVFTAGLAIGATAKPLVERTGTFAEAEGQLLSLLTFGLFGVVFTAELVTGFNWHFVVYALVSMLVVRPLAVALSTIGNRVRIRTVVFIAWAGPRGLASIVYVVLIVETAGVPHTQDIFLVAGWTIVLSIYLHGLSAANISARYGAAMAHVPKHHPEHRGTTELPLRLPFHQDFSTNNDR